MRKLQESEATTEQVRKQLADSEREVKRLEMEINRLNAQLQSTQGQLQEELNNKIRECE